MKTDYINNFLKKAAVVALTFVGFTAIAQEEEIEEAKKINFSGSVDAYFRTNLDADSRPGVAPATSFANGTGFSIGMANLIASYDGEHAGVVADLVFGPRGEEAVFNSVGSAAIVNQLYGYWNASESLTLTFGNFNTFLGYEVISATGNFNYSTSYMFSYGPFSHTGLKADIAIDDNWSAMLAVMNPTDFTETNPFDTYIIGAQLGYATDNGSAYLNFRYGNEGEPGAVGPTFQVDLTTGWDVSEEFFLGVNGTYLSTDPQEDGDASGFYGIALYPQFKTSESFTVGLRGEYFSEFEGGVGALTLDDEGNGSVFAATVTGSYTVGDLTFKPEFRLDSASENNFIDKDGEDLDLNGFNSKSLSSFTLAAIYSF